MKNIIKKSILCLIFTTSMIMTCPDDEDIIVNIATQDELEMLLTNIQGPSAIYMDKYNVISKMYPIFEMLANDNKFDHVTFYKVHGPNLKGQTLVKNILNEQMKSYPSILFMNQGNIVSKQIGETPKEVIIQQLNLLSN